MELAKSSMRCMDLCAREGASKNPTRLQEGDVVWYYEGVQLQGHNCMVPSAEGQKKRPSRTNFSFQEKQEETSQLEYIIGSKKKR